MRTNLHVMSYAESGKFGTGSYPSQHLLHPGAKPRTGTVINGYDWVLPI